MNNMDDPLFLGLYFVAGTCLTVALNGCWTKTCADNVTLTYANNHVKSIVGSWRFQNMQFKRFITKKVSEVITNSSH